MKKKLFTNEQEEYILEAYKYKSNQELADELGCTRVQINSWLQHRNIKRTAEEREYCSKIFSKEDIDYIKANYFKMSASQIAKNLGYKTTQIQGKVANLGLNDKKRKINDDYFSSIDSSLKAYFLGFIYADGWIVCNKDNGNYEFGMQLQSEDKYILEKLNYELGDQNIIYHCNPKEILILGKQVAHSNHSDCLRVYSKKLVEDLMELGIETNKSSKDTIPNVNDEFFFDFLRGYIDGDGCYYYSKNNVYMHITCASIEALKIIQNRLLKYDIETHIYSENNKKHRLMCVNTHEMKKLVGRLYYEDGLFFMQRKFERIKHLTSLAA